MLKNIFIYVGVYTTIATIWRIYEIKKDGTIQPKKRDNIIAFVLAFVISCFFWQ